MNTLFASLPSARVIEHKGLRCFVREGSADELIFHENIVKAEVIKYLSVGADQNWLDLGGFIGTFAMFVMHRGANVFSVEAFPESADCYIRNVKLNGFKNYVLVNAAVMCKPMSDTVDLHLATPYAGKTRAGGISAKRITNHAVNTLHSRWKRPHPKLTVPTISFAEVVQQAYKKYGTKRKWCLKADIEGAEVDILETADLSRFDQIFFEYHYQAGGGSERARRVMEKIKGEGFNLRLNHPVKDGPLWWNQTYHLGWAWK